MGLVSSIKSPNDSISSVSNNTPNKFKANRKGLGIDNTPIKLTSQSEDDEEEFTIQDIKKIQTNYEPGDP